MYMKLQTDVSLDEYKKFARKAAELHMTEYELLQTIVRGFITDVDPNRIILVLKQAIKEFEQIMSCENCP
jgi:hypothetical protein